MGFATGPLNPNRGAPNPGSRRSAFPVRPLSPSRAPKQTRESPPQPCRGCCRGPPARSIRRPWRRGRKKSESRREPWGYPFLVGFQGEPRGTAPFRCVFLCGGTLFGWLQKETTRKTHHFAGPRKETRPNVPPFFGWIAHEVWS